MMPLPFFLLRILYGALLVAVMTMTFASCSYDRGRGEAPATEEDSPDSIATGPPPSEATYQVFLENSGSMDGYVRGITAFEDDIYQLLVDIGYVSDRLMLFYMNSKPIPYTEGTEKFINNLEPDDFQQRGGNRSNSNLNQIFGDLLNRTSDRRVVVLVSDFILSLGQGDTQDLLNNQRISVYNNFRQRLEEQDFATYIVKMYSDFTGNYYTKADQPVYLDGVRRPYYLWFIGPAVTIQSLPEVLNVEELPGFANSYTLLPVEEPSIPFYTVLNNTYKRGSFRTNRGAAGQGYVHGIKDAKPNRRGSDKAFGFSIAADLSQVAADQRYLLDPANYEVQGYRLDTIIPIKKTNALHPRDQAMVEDKTTHLLAFSTTDGRYGDLQVSLRAQIPAWVTQTHSDDDTEIKNDSVAHDQTFGFRYLVAGVEEAYRNVYGQAPYFRLTVSVNR